MASLKQRRESYERGEAALRAEGAEPIGRSVTGSGHLCIRFRLGGREARLTMAATPSDRRTSANDLACVKKVVRRLREMP